jgi:hypothetical protein
MTATTATTLAGVLGSGHSRSRFFFCGCFSFVRSAWLPPPGMLMRRFSPVEPPLEWASSSSAPSRAVGVRRPSGCA